MRIQTLCCLSVIALTSEAFATDTEELKALCRNGHMQAREAIRSLQCRCEIEVPAGREQSPYDGRETERPAKRVVIQWWQSEDVIRSRVEYGDNSLSIDVLWKGGVLKTLRRQGVRPADSRFSGQIDGEKALEIMESPWRLALFGWPDKSPLKFDSPTLKSIEPGEFKGAKCYRAVSDWGSGGGEVWFDIRHNFLVRRRVTYPVATDRQSSISSEVLSFREGSPGVFFPESVERKSTSGGKTTLQDRVNFKDVKINTPIDPSVFQLAFPAGVKVADTVKGVVYTTGPAEEPSGPTEPIPPPRDFSKVEYPTGMGGAWTVDRYAILAACVAGVAVVAAVVWFRSRKARNA